ncbi:MAG: NAD(P)-dependent alcohol dehydrogenase [Cryomorphaceae bacterium]
MKAITYSRYGGPEVLALKEIDAPVPGDSELLIRVHALSINPYDWHFMRGTPYFMRIASGLLHPKKAVLGNDVAGIVEAIGKDVTKFTIGDRVVGAAGLGGMAEYATIGENNAVQISDNIPMNEASALNIAAITALDAVKKYAGVKKGQSVLVNGASGGVGHYCIQIAKASGAHVTGVCSARNIEMVRALGADEVIDYTAGKWIGNTVYDAVIDVVGNLSPKDLEQLCHREGRIAVVGYQNMSRLFSIVLRSFYGKPRLEMVTIKETQKEISEVLEMAASRKLTTVIDKVYSLQDAAEAMRYLEKGHARGKVIIEVP